MRGGETDKRGKFSFLKALRYNTREVILKLDDKIKVRLPLFRAAIVNVSSRRGAEPRANPQDGILNVFITAKIIIGKKIIPDLVAAIIFADQFLDGSHRTESHMPAVDIYHCAKTAAERTTAAAV